MVDSDVNLDISYQRPTPDDQSDHRATRIISRKLVPKTLVSDNTVERGPGLGYLLMSLFDLLKTHACADHPKLRTMSGITSPEEEIIGDVKDGTNTDSDMDGAPEIFL